MLKKTVTYEDFNGNTQTEHLYFNLTKTELLDHMHLEDELKSLSTMLEGDTRDMGMDEVKRILDMVKTFMEISYGERSEDGKRFFKDAGIWRDFQQSAVYDAFLFGLFENPEEAVAFLTGVFPSDLMEKAADQVAGRPAPQDFKKKERPARLDDRRVVDTELPAAGGQQEETPTQSTPEIDAQVAAFRANLEGNQGG